LISKSIFILSVKMKSLTAKQKKIVKL